MSNKRRPASKTPAPADKPELPAPEQRRPLQLEWQWFLWGLVTPEGNIYHRMFGTEADAAVANGKYAEQHGTVHRIVRLKITSPYQPIE
jgi:hypothetical protein